MKATYFCNDCETTTEINATELPESVSCPNCNAAMDEIKVPIEDMMLERFGRDAGSSVQTVMGALFGAAVAKLGNSPAMQRKIARSLTLGTRSGLKTWSEIRRVALKNPTE